MNASTALRLALSFWVAVLSGCAVAPPVSTARIDAVFHDELFAPVAVDPAAALVASPAMRARLAALRSRARRDDDPRRLLLEALAGPGDDRLRLEYDASVTRTAAEAFDARRGNCLSLVLLTASFAHELRLPVRYQAVVGPAEWAHAGGLALAVGHVNVALDTPTETSVRRWEASPTLVVDFLPSAQAERLRSRPIDERTLVAMYLNNRAVEALVDGRDDAAYAWASAAVRADTGYDAALLTLGVVYRQHGHPAHAAAVLQRVVDRDARNGDALVDLALALRDLGRDAEAADVDRRLARLGGGPPFSAYDAGIAAYREGRFAAARDLFAEALARVDGTGHGAADAEFWLARTFARLNDLDAARRHLDRALAASHTVPDPPRYAAKLDRLKALADAAPH